MLRTNCSDEENPFRPGGDLSREAEDLLRHSVILRSKVLINDPHAVESPPPNSFRPTAASTPIGGRLSNRSSGGKQHSVHFSPVEEVAEDDETGRRRIENLDGMTKWLPAQSTVKPTANGCGYTVSPEVKLKDGEEGWCVSSEATVHRLEEVVPLQAEHITLKSSGKSIKNCCELM